MGVWKYNLFCFGRKGWREPAEKNGGGKSAQKLRYYKTGRIDRTNSSKGVSESSCKRYRWIGKGGGSCKPVCACDVKADRHGNSLGAQTGTAPNYTEQPERRNLFAKELTATGADVMREL
jgi:hypothetical protein